MDFIHQPNEANRLGDFLRLNFNKDWKIFRAAIAFVKRSGTKHLLPSLSEFSKKSPSEIIVGIDLRGTSKEGLDDLLSGIGNSGRVIVFHNEIFATFHPKIYLFKSDASAEILIGSGNLTEGGLFTNYEASVLLKLDLSDANDLAFLSTVEDVLDKWANLEAGTAHVLNAELLSKLVVRGYVPIEALAASDAAEERDSRKGLEKDEPEENAQPTERIFAARAVPRAPTTKSSEKLPAEVDDVKLSDATSDLVAGVIGFVMTLQKTDVGVGQTTAGTSRRSPEIFIPLSARDAEPEFWGWDDEFEEDQTKPGKFDRQGVKMRIGSEIITVNMMTWPDKHDFRLRSEALRSAGEIGDILRIEKAEETAEFDYYVEIVPQSTTQHPVYLERCTEPVRNSKKAYGYY